MSNYIMDLRAVVGHRPLMQVGASVLLEDEEGRLLLQKRRDNGCWGYHGGSVELDEAVEAAAARELFEETGLTADELCVFGVFSGEDMHYVYPNGDEVSNVDVVYLCRKWHGDLRAQPQEVDELRFFSADALPERLSPPNVPALTAWQRQKNEQSVRTE